jgi:diketogulonate reductase-like aldo/keto reductase
VYGNEREIGRALRKARVPRAELFVTSKIWNTFRTAEQVRSCCQTSLSDLGIDYLDLLLVHFPVGGRAALKETWQTMEALVDQGKCKHIGVSNYYEDDIADLLSYARIMPSCNQIELHPRLPQEALVATCKRHGMVVTAYSPFGRGARGGMLDHPVVSDIARKHSVAASTVLLGWSLARGVPALPKAVTPSHIRLNHSDEVYDLTLDAEDLSALRSLNDGARFVPFYNHQTRRK